jgi:predicted GNAT superfamily acetyltransferase
MIYVAMTKTSSDTANITFRVCYKLEDFEQIAALQEKIWGDSPRELTPSHIFLAIKKSGGQIFAASDQEQMIGFLLGLIGLQNGEPYIHSHLTGILPEYQHCGIGYQLKLKQREDALARNIHRIEWTFDPFKLRNAYFNFNKLGAIAKTYLPNVYGMTVSPFDQGMPTDRLLAEWELDAPRYSTASGSDLVTLPRKQIANAVHKIFVPAENQTLQIQTEIREKFQSAFAQGLIVTSVERVEAGMNYCLLSL